MTKVKTLSIMAAVFSLTLGAAVSIAGAQQPGDQSGNPGGGMTGMMNGVDAAQMNRIMQNCNRMMESMMQTPNTPPTQAPEKKG